MNQFTELRLTFPNLFARFERVEIPIIQRDYAQGRATAEDVRSGLLEAMLEALERAPDDNALPLDLDFVYGSISTTKKDNVETVAFAPLDGQQRLTTLFLLHWFAAWSEGEFDKFQALYLKDGKSRFAYLVRPSATEFFDTLARFFPDSEDVGEKMLSKYIEEQPWFFLYWKQDPTIQSALVMLDSIQKRFGKVAGLYSKLTDPEVPRITFQFLDLEQFGLSDDLYIKMNARGKPLTAFENFKAKLEQKLASDFTNWKEKGDTGLVPVKDYFSHRIETRWADLFWHFRDPKSRLFDDKVMALCREIATATRNPEDEKFEEVVQELRSQKGVLTYQWFAKVGAVDEPMLRSLFGTLEQLSGLDDGIRTFLEDKAYLDEEGLFQRSIDSRTSLNYEETVMLRAYTGYLVEHRDSIDPVGLWNWVRVVANLSRNTIYNRPEDFQRSLRALNSLFEHSESILEFLGQNADTIAGFNQQQVREEQLKAQLIIRSDAWLKLIVEAECHKYFAGQIEFLFKFSGVLDHWLDEKTCDWSEQMDEEFRSHFVACLKRANLIFGDDGLKHFDHFLWERALLAEGDYLVESGRNYSFLRSEGRETSWKRLLRGDPKKPSEEARRDVVWRVMDQLDPEGDVVAALKRIVDRAQVAEHWRELLVLHPEAIAYCENRLIRKESDERIYLLKRSQLNGTHADLFTYCLLEEIDKLASEGKLSRFEVCEYRHMTDTWNEPGIILTAEFGNKPVTIEVLNSRDGEARYVIGIPWVADSPVEANVWPAAAELGFTMEQRIDKTQAMELRVERDKVIETLRQLGEHLFQPSETV
jgi:hypothetical protein